ncbi:MAG TPA: radical SAM protein, partial [Myxococcota bacterium]|nr:radical SAM protein [Myxococcota bacterium]
MSNVYQGLPGAREIVIGAVRFGWIGRTVVFGRTCLLLRAGDIDVELAISSGDAGDEAAFVVSGPLQARYRTYPAEAPVSVELAGALKALCLHVMAGMDGASSRPPEPLESETARVVARIPPPKGTTVELRESSGGMYRLSLRSDGEVPLADILVTAGRGGPGCFMGWSFDIVSAAALSESILKSLANYAMAIAAGLGISVASGTYGRGAASPVTKILVDLSAPVPDKVKDLLRSAANVNLSLLFSGDCGQVCTFCTVSEIRDFRGQAMAAKTVADIAAVLRERQKQVPGGLELRLAGSDPLSVPLTDLASMLSDLSTLDIGDVTICSPALKLADADYVRCIRDNFGQAVIETTLHGPDAEIHDSVCGAPGSFDLLMRALSNCRDAGIRVVLNHVIVRNNQEFMPRTLLNASSLGMRLRLMMFIPAGGNSDAVVDRNLPAGRRYPGGWIPPQPYPPKSWAMQRPCARHWPSSARLVLRAVHF